MNWLLMRDGPVEEVAPPWALTDPELDRQLNTAVGDYREALAREQATRRELRASLGQRTRQEQPAP